VNITSTLPFLFLENCFHHIMYLPSYVNVPHGQKQYVYITKSATETYGPNWTHLPSWSHCPKGDNESSLIRNLSCLPFMEAHISSDSNWKMISFKNSASPSKDATCLLVWKIWQTIFDNSLVQLVRVWRNDQYNFTKPHFQKHRNDKPFPLIFTKIQAYKPL
jgi:hypothetical protein